MVLFRACLRQYRYLFNLHTLYYCLGTINPFFGPCKSILLIRYLKMQSSHPFRFTIRSWITARESKTRIDFTVESKYQRNPLFSLLISFCNQTGIHLLIIPSTFNFFLNTHLHPIILQPSGRITKCQL